MEFKKTSILDPSPELKNLLNQIPFRKPELVFFDNERIENANCHICYEAIRDARECQR